MLTLSEGLITPQEPLEEDTLISCIMLLALSFFTWVGKVKYVAPGTGRSEILPHHKYISLISFIRLFSFYKSAHDNS